MPPERSCCMIEMANPEEDLQFPSNLWLMETGCSGGDISALSILSSFRDRPGWIFNES